MENAPIQTPKKSAGMTLLKNKAIKMDINGGIIESQPQSTSMEVMSSNTSPAYNSIDSEALSLKTMSLKINCFAFSQLLG